MLVRLYFLYLGRECYMWKINFVFKEVKKKIFGVVLVGMVIIVSFGCCIYFC